MFGNEMSKGRRSLVLSRVMNNAINSIRSRSGVPGRNLSVVFAMKEKKEREGERDRQTEIDR